MTTRSKGCKAKSGNQSTNMPQLFTEDGNKNAAESICDLDLRQHLRQQEKQSENDDQSFALFNHSFDSFPENMHSLASVHSECYDSPVANPKATAPRPKHGSAVHSGQQSMDQDYSPDDISPIKFIFTESPRQQDHTVISKLSNKGFSSSLQSKRKSLDESNEGYFGHWNAEFTNPFYVIRVYREVFKDFSHLLECLRFDHDCRVHVTNISHVRHYKEYGDCFPLDLDVAKRRVNAAVCFFGGRVQSKARQRESIFRVASKEREEYAEGLHGRYYLSSSRISWEVEADPPVSHVQHWKPHEATESKGQEIPERRERQKSAASHTEASSSSVSSDTQKMKYRCKLCNQPKQNHKCPYRYSLHRSIGVMVYPAVNSFTAAEPGTIAPPLTHMNNFVSYDSDHGSTEPVPHPKIALAATHLSSMISPDSLHSSGAMYFSPQSSISAQSEEDTAHYTNGQTDQGKTSLLSGCKRRISEVEHVGTKPSPGCPFVTVLPLRPEQFRAVTPSHEREGSFQYPHIPLTFAERKRLSDTLFSLSKQIPTMTRECAAVLREARARDDWDTAVAELLTQVIVALHCNEQDPRLDGLHKYLLALGISC